MGKLYTGKYGEDPTAESIAMPLRECNQKLSLKPTDFVSTERPDFYRRSFGAHGRYVVYEVETSEANAVWKAGYYLLPKEAIDILQALQRGRNGLSTGSRPFEMETKGEPPPQIASIARRWAEKSQELLMKCKCETLKVSLKEPWALRRRWSIRLSCPGRCQPALKALI